MTSILVRSALTLCGAVMAATWVVALAGRARSLYVRAALGIAAVTLVGVSFVVLAYQTGQLVLVCLAPIQAVLLLLAVPPTRPGWIEPLLGVNVVAALAAALMRRLFL